jgi:hypothetical protein
MASIYLKHPIHGHKVANMDLEVEEDLKHGWEKYEPEASVEIEEPETPETPETPAETLPGEVPEKPAAVVAPKNRRTTA